MIKLIEGATEKVCRRCLEMTPLEDFHANNSAADGKNCYCKRCANEISLEWKRDKKAAYREENNLEIGQRKRGRNKSFTNLSVEQQLEYDANRKAELALYQAEYHREYQKRITAEKKAAREAAQELAESLLTEEELEEIRLAKVIARQEARLRYKAKQNQKRETANILKVFDCLIDLQDTSQT